MQLHRDRIRALTDSRRMCSAKRELRMEERENNTRERKENDFVHGARNYQNDTLRDNQVLRGPVRRFAAGSGETIAFTNGEA